MQSLSFETSASIAIDLQCSFLISLDTCSASSILLELVTIEEYSFGFANAIAIAFPIPLLDPVTIAIFFCIIYASIMTGVRNIVYKHMDLRLENPLYEIRKIQILRRQYLP